MALLPLVLPRESQINDGENNTESEKIITANIYLKVTKMYPFK